MRHSIFLKRAFTLIILFIIFDTLISTVLIKGLNKYYGFGKNPEVLINGSSMAMAGFNKMEIEKLTKKKIATYTHEGVSIYDRFEMISHFYHMYPEGVKTVVYEINPILFSNIKTSDNVYTLFYPFMDDSTINRYIKENAGLKEYYLNKIIRTKRFDSRLIRLIMMGYLGKYENLKTNTLDTTTLFPLIAQKDKIEVDMEKSNINIFENTMELISSHNSDIILVMMPMFHTKLETFNREEYQNLINYLEKFTSARENIKFLNLNQDSLILNAGYFSDQLHFNVYGQHKITDIISSHLTGD